MNLRELAASLVKMADDLDAKIDASSLSDVVAAIKTRIEGSSASKYSKDAHTIELKIAITDGENGFDPEWKIWDGSMHHNGSTLAVAFAGWRAVWLAEPQLSLDVIAGTLDPKLRKKIAAAAAEKEPIEA